MIPYEFNNNELKFIIAFINKVENNYYYKFQINSFLYKLEIPLENGFKKNIFSYSNKTYQIEDNTKKNSIKNFFFTCNVYATYYYTYKFHFFYYSYIINNYNELICFYSTNNNMDINAARFNIEQKFKYIDSIKIFNKDKYHIIQIKSSILNDYIFVCANYYKNTIDNLYDYLFTYCFAYNINYKEFIYEYKINNCLSLEIYSFKETNELILACYVDNNFYNCTIENCQNFQLVKFKEENSYFKYNKYIKDKEFNISLLECSKINSFSLIYNYINKEYGLISDCLNNINDTYKIIYSSSIELYSVPNDTNKKKLTKEELVKNLPEVMNLTKIGEKNEIIGEDYILTIQPINSSYSNFSTHINFTECENILRKTLNINESRILTFLQLEINNTNEQSLVNKVEYQVYDDNKNLLDLSLCNETNVQVFHEIKDGSLIDVDSVSTFKDLGIDIFNINDSFFNDICQSFSDSNNDIVLEDRIKEYYQNYSLCEEGCTYNAIIYEYMTISCDCKVKTNISTNETIQQSYEINIDSNFGIIKCYKLVFSFKGKFKNIGFWIFLLLVGGHISLIIIYFYKGIKPIKEYLIYEMKKYGYIKGDKIEKNSSTFISFPPPRYTTNNNNNNERNKKDNKNNNLIIIDNSSANNMKPSEREIINQINSQKIKINDCETDFQKYLLNELNKNLYSSNLIFEKNETDQINYNKNKIIKDNNIKNISSSKKKKKKKKNKKKKFVTKVISVDKLKNKNEEIKNNNIENLPNLPTIGEEKNKNKNNEKNMIVLI